MKDRLEFYFENSGIAYIDSSIVPPVDSLISILKRTYRVTRITYALDYAELSNREKQMRVNIDLELLK